MTATSDHTMTLPDGRRLGYAEYGDPDGHPLFYFHGHPGSRVEARFLDQAAALLGIRVVGVDRPGMGLSDYQSDRHVLDWPADTTALADHLGMQRFAVLGFSGGSPYALACAHSIGDRLTGCGVVSGVGHTSATERFLSRWLPWILLPVARRFVRDQASAERALIRFAGRWVAPDQTALRQPAVSQIMAASLAEALRPGARGAARDGTLIAAPPAFPVEHFSLNVAIWHGERDNQVPVASIRTLASHIPNVSAVYYPDEGHISTIVNHAKEILTALQPPNETPAA